MEDHTQNKKHRLGSLFNLLFSLVVGVYIAALACYLLMRALFGDRFWWLSLVNTFAYLLFLPLLLLLPAALVFKMRRNALRLIPVALIGGLWLAPYYFPRTPNTSVPAGQTLRALTFNVWGFNPRMDDVMAWVRDSGADVVLLQEITPGHIQDVLPKVYDLYPYHYNQEDWHHWNGRGTYNTTLSRYPIVSVEEVNFQTPDTSNPVRVVLDVNGQNVAIYNVHMAWPGGNPRFPIPARINTFFARAVLGYSDKLRNAQINSLLDHLKVEPYPFIVAGDFNTSDQTPTYNLIASHLHNSFRESGSGLGGSWPVSSARGLPGFIPPLIRIDYIWHSDSFQTIAAQQGPPLGSDHLALTATLQLLPTHNMQIATQPAAGIGFRLRKFARRAFIVAASAYIVLLIGYLLLRIVFGDGVWWLSFLNALAHLWFLPLIVLFPLAILIDRRTAFRLMPLVLIAGLWFGPYYLPKPVTETVSPTLHVLTFNVWGDNPRMNDVENWIRDSGADVVLLQEIPETYSENGFANLLDVYPHQLVQSLDTRTWGNAILSRIPFGETENFDLEDDGTPSHQRVTFDWQGTTVALYNIHLLIPIGDQAHFWTPIDNPFLHLALKYDDTPRDAEIGRLTERLDAETLPFIMGGDFNTSDQSVIYQQLAAHGRDSFREVGNTFGASWPLPVNGEFPAFIPPLLRMDYIWHSDLFQAIQVQQGPPLGSDHLALLATLALSPNI